MFRKVPNRPAAKGLTKGVMVLRVRAAAGPTAAARRVCECVRARPPRAQRRCAPDWSVVRIYPHFLRLMGPP
eukprot:623422-Prorocentrum_minimum.AAC.4